MQQDLVPVEQQPLIETPLQDEPQFNVAYQIVLTAIKETKRLRVAFVFTQPEHLYGTEAFHITLDHREAGQFARMVEKERQRIA